jgi:hypothetical protein
MAGEKERQGDFVFTAQTVGEYRVCFNNEMSTFADKMVDFEIAVCFHGLQCAAAVFDFLDTGRRRVEIGAPPSKGRLFPRTTLRPRGPDLQGQRTIEHCQSHAEILPNPREPQLQYGQEHRTENLQLQSD